MNLYEPKEKILNLECLLALVETSNMKVDFQQNGGYNSDYTLLFKNKTNNSASNIYSLFSVLECKVDEGNKYIGFNLSFLLGLPHSALEIIDNELGHGLYAEIKFVETNGILFNVVENESFNVILRIL